MYITYLVHEKHRLGPNHHLSCGDTLALAPTNTPDHLVADGGLAAHVQCQQLQDQVCCDGLALALAH